MTKKNFTIGRKAPEAKAETIAVAEDNFITGQPREVTKSFRMPEDLAFLLKKYAVESRQTEKDVLIGIISEHLKKQ